MKTVYARMKETRHFFRSACFRGAKLGDTNQARTEAALLNGFVRLRPDRFTYVALFA